MGFDLTSVNQAVSSVNSAIGQAQSIAGIASQIPTSLGQVQGLVTGKVASLTSGLTSSISSALGGLNAGSVSELAGGGGTDATTSGSSSDDLRVRLSAQNGAEEQVYGPVDEKSTSNVLGILHNTDGLLFPYTPNIEWTQAVEYQTMSLTHSNQDFLTYKNTPSTTIRVTGEFTVSNYREAQYMIAVIHFLRVVSKMYFGKPVSGYPSGMPPPVLIFSGYGDFMFDELPVIVRDHGYTLPKDVDYIDVEVAGGKVRLPAVLTITMGLTVQQTPKKLREEFNLDQFRTGELMKKKGGWI